MKKLSMKKIFIFSLSAVSFSLGAMLLFGILERQGPREKYETFINQSFARAKDWVKPSKEGRLESPDQPDMAAMQEYFKTIDPKLKRVPTERLWKAYKQTQKIEQQQKAFRGYDTLLQWEGTGANMGGRTRTLMFDPNDVNHKKVWAGGVTGGLWYTSDITNVSSQWIPVGDFWSNLAISSMAYDPNNTQTFYVGTGEAQTARLIYRKSSGLGSGIFKTTDGGQTWELIPSTHNFAYVTGIVVRNENGISAIYAGVVSGTYMGKDHISQPSDGLYRSTDGGNTWAQVLPLIPGTQTNEHYAVADIEIAANGRIFVGTMENLNLIGGATILYSDSGLAGSWTVYSHYNTLIGNENYYNIPARTIIAVAPSDSNRVYAQFAAGYTNGFIYYRGRYMAKSMDGGNTWTAVTIPDPDWSTLAWHAFNLQVSPNDPNTVFSGGLDLWRTSNAGNSWNHVSDWSLMYWGGGDAYVHADQHKIQYQPGSSSTAIFSCDGGVFLTNTANIGYPVFIQRNQGYNTLQFYSCAIKPTPGSHQYIGGLQDNGTLKYTGSPLSLNSMIDGGDGAFCFWDNDQASIYITSVYYNQYTTYYNGSSVGSFGGNSGTFISPADYDYRDNILYSNAVGFFGGNANKLLRAKNIPFSPTNQLINIGTSTSVPFSSLTYSQFSPTGTSTLFVGTESGELFKVTDAQDIPHTIEIGSADFPTANISCVAIGNSEDTLLVTFSNYGVSSVWQTYNGGISWQEKEANLPDMPIRWALYHPGNNGQALLATEIGVWATNTLKEDETVWAPAVDGMANVRVDMLKMRSADNMVLAASHGRGLFTATWNVDLYTGEKENFAFTTQLKVYPNPTTAYCTVSSNLVTPGSVSVELLSLNGKIVFSENIEVQNGEIQKRIDVSSLPRAIYIVRLQHNGLTESKKLVVR